MFSPGQAQSGSGPGGTVDSGIPGHSAPHRLQRDATPPDSNANEPGLESDWLGGVLVAVVGAVVTGADIAGEVANAVVVEGIIGAAEDVGDFLSGPVPDDPGPSDGMGSGAGAAPGSVDSGDDGDSGGDGTDGGTGGGGGGGSGIDDTPGHQQS